MMTKLEWLNEAKNSRKKLESLIKHWHPRSEILYHDMKITAPAAELTCTDIRNKIRLENKDDRDPVERFNDGLDRDDWLIVCQILNETWFGVPESVSCWNIEGFTEAIYLIEDPPSEDDDYDNKE